MAEYIEREALKEQLHKRLKNPVIISWLYSIIAETPAADVVEVVHGEWETKPNAGGYEVCMRCSVCGFQFDNWQHIFKYCPVCGAKMDATDIDVGTKTKLPDDVRQNILNTFMKGSED